MCLFHRRTNAAQQVSSNGALTVRVSRCPQNHACPAVRVCPTGALTQQGYQAPSIAQGACVRCGKCVKTCPMGALSFT